MLTRLMVVTLCGASAFFPALAQTNIEIGTSSIPAMARPWFLEQVQAFDDAHPDISVTLYREGEGQRPWGWHIKDLPRLARNVVGIQAPIGAEIDYLAPRELVLPLDALFEDPEFEKDAFYPNAFSSAQYGGITYGVPWCIDAFWLACDWPLFEAEGIEEPPKTWTEFLDYAKRLTKDLDGDGEIDQWGFQVPPEGLGVELLMVTTMNSQNGAGFMSLDPKYLENLKWVSALLSSGFVRRYNQNLFATPASEGHPSAMQIFHTGNPYSSWFPQAMQALYENPRMRFALIPSDGESVRHVTARHYLLIRPGTPEEEAASWEFLKWMVRKDIPLDPRGWFGWPSRKDIVDREDFKAWEASIGINASVAVQSAAQSRELGIKHNLAMYNINMRYFYAIFRGNVSAEEGLAANNEEIRPFLLREDTPLNVDEIFE